MMTLDKETAIRKITEMPAERVLKVLIFMAGMEAEYTIDEKSGKEEERDDPCNWGRLRNNGRGSACNGK